MDKEEDERGSILGGVSPATKRGVLRFYQWALVLAPIILMLSHWYIFYVFSQNRQELLQYSSANEICIAWIYTILYLYVPLILLPASYFIKQTNFFRIPFVYFIFINIERWYYDSWFCTNEMIDTHYFLIYCIISMYILEVIGICLRHRRNLPNHFKAFLPYIVQGIRNHMGKHSNNKYSSMMNMLREDKP